MIREVAQYEIIERIGSGGFGEVFLAKDRKLGRRVALKILPELMRVGAPDDDGATVAAVEDDRRERFYREARSAAALDDPRIVTIYEFGDFAGGCFIAMEYVQGKTMKRLLADAPPSIEEVCSIGMDVCSALETAHKSGIVHRDVKSENIMRTEDGRVKVLDFGLARQETAATITRSGDIMGTPAYMSPEQALGEKVDARSDLYSLGVVLYELLTGQLPFSGANPVAVLYSLVNEEPPRPREIRPSIPEDLERIVLKALMKDPERRYASAPELGVDLSKFRDYFLGWGDGVAPALLATEEVYAARRRTFEAELVGRAKEMHRLRELIADAFAGQTRAVMISGEAGIGKSRLVSEVQQEARSKRALNLMGRCLYGEGAFPYQPLVDATRRHLATLGVENDAAFEQFLRTQMPDLLAHERALRSFLHFSSEPLEESARREQLWEAFRSFLVVLSRQRPVTFLLEDLHWADESTLALAVYLMARIRESRLLFLGTYRPEEPDSSGAVERLLEAVQALSREEWFELFRLERLRPEEVSLAVRSLFGADGLGAAPEEALFHETGGNPFFLLETLRYLAQEGKLVQEDGAWRLSAEWDPAALPEKVLDVVRRRIDRLEETERDLLDVAAVQGEVFESDVLSEALGMNRIKLLKSLQRLEKQHHLIRPSITGYIFDHATIRRALYESINAELRGEYHLTVGRAIAGLHEGEPGRAAAVAHHLVAGGDEPGAVPYLVAAGRDAKRVFANSEAREFLRRAIAILDSPRGAAIPGADAGGLRMEGLGLLGDIDLLTSRHEEALASFERMRELAQAAGRPEIAGTADIGLGLSYYNRAEFARALACFESAAEVYGKAGETSGIALALDKIGIVHTKQGRYQEALDLHSQALKIWREIGDRVGEAVSLNNIAIIYRNWGRLDEALEAQERALALKRECGERRGAAISLINLGNVLLLLQRRAEALERYKEALESSREIGDRRLMAYPLSSMGNTFFEEDDYDAASEHYRLALSLYDEIGDRWGSGRALNNLGVIELRRAEYAAALDHLTLSLVLKRQVDDARSIADTLINIGEVHRRLGRLEDAAVAHEEAQRMADEAGDAKLIARVRFGLGAVAAERQDRPRALELLFEAREAAAGIAFIETEVESCAMLAEVLQERDPKEAIACATKADERARAEGNAQDRARAGLNLARVLHTTGVPALPVLEEARRTAESHGFREILCGCLQLETVIRLERGENQQAARSAAHSLEVVQEILRLGPEESRASFLERPEMRLLLSTASSAFHKSDLPDEAARLSEHVSGSPPPRNN